MFLNYSSFSLRKAPFKRIKNCFICFNQKELKILNIKFVLSKHHRILHTLLYPQPFPRTYIRDILKNPLNILQLEGSRRVNLLLLLAITGDIYLPVLQNLNPSQQTLYNLMTLKNEEWNELFEYDICTFIRLENTLKIKMLERLNVDERVCAVVNMTGFRAGTVGYDIILFEHNLNMNNNKDNKNINKYNTNTNNINTNTNTNNKDSLFNFKKAIYISHHEFCCCKNDKSTLPLQIKSYTKMLKNIKNNEYKNNIYEPFNFYNEIDLLNGLILPNGSEDMPDFDSLKSKYTTDNERRIFKFIKNKAKKKDL